MLWWYDTKKINTACHGKLITTPFFSWQRRRGRGMSFSCFRARLAVYSSATHSLAFSLSFFPPKKMKTKNHTIWFCAGFSSYDSFGGHVLSSQLNFLDPSKLCLTSLAVARYSRTGIRSSKAVSDLSSNQLGIGIAF